MSDMTQQPEEGVPDLAAVMQEILGILEDHEKRIVAVCAGHEDLDKEIHEDFFGPIHQQYKASVRGKGIDDLKGRYGSQFDELSEPLKGFGIDDLYGRLYDELEKIKGEKDYGPEREKSFIDGIHSQAMERIAQVRGPKIEETPKAEEKKPATAIAVEVKKEPGSVREKLAAGKKQPSMLDGY